MQDIRRQVGIAIRWLPLIVVIAVAAGAAAFAWSNSQPTVYESTASLVVDPGPTPSIQDLAVAQDAAARYARDVLSPVVAREVIDKLGSGEDPRALLRRISVETDPDSLVLAITASARTAQEATLIAKTIGDAMQARVRESLITNEVRLAERAIERTEDALRSVNRRLGNLQGKPNKTVEDRAEMNALLGQLTVLQQALLDYRQSSRESVRNRLEWFEQPRTPTAPSEPRPLYWTLLALVVGGMLAAAIAFGLEYLLRVNRVRDERDLEVATDLPTLGTAIERRGDVGRGGLDRLVTLRFPGSKEAEAYRNLVTRIGFAGGSSRSLMVASPGESDAKHAVAANLALAYAESARNVLLVDADHRSPGLHRLFDLPNDRGLTNILNDPETPLGWVTVPTPHPRLGIVPAGPRLPESARALDSTFMNALLRRLLHAADLVVFVSPSMSANLDTAILASYIDQAVLVVPTGTSPDDAAEAARALDGAAVHLAGMILYRQLRGAHSRRSAATVIQPRTSPPPPEPGQPRQIPAVAVEARSSASSASSTMRQSPTTPAQPEAPKSTLPPPHQAPAPHVSPPPRPRQEPPLSSPPYAPPGRQPTGSPAEPSAGRAGAQPWGSPLPPSRVAGNGTGSPGSTPTAGPGARPNGTGWVPVGPGPYAAPYDPSGMAPQGGVASKG